MTAGQAFLRDVAPLREELHLQKRSWMRGVLATGIGPKYVDGQPSGDPAVHLFVRRKRARGDLAKERLIPKTLNGYPTDVLDGRGTLPVDGFTVPVSSVGVGVGVGFGVPLYGSNGERATTACCGIDTNGNSVLLTAAHMVSPGEFVMDDSGTVTFGKTAATYDAMPANVLYPTPSAGPQPCAVDIALVPLVPGIVPQRGLPGGSSFLLQSWQDTYRWIMSCAGAGVPAQAAAIGAARTGGRPQTVWRRGVIASMMPRVVADGLLFFCAINDGGTSERGDSGSVWLGIQNGEYVALGVHYGILNQTSYALVTNFAAALPHLPITQLLT